MLTAKRFALSASTILTISALGNLATTRAASLPLPDFSGIWRLDDRHSDNATDIIARLQAERKREQPPQVQPATASSSGAPAVNLGSHGGHGGGGGGHGMGGGGGGGGGMGGGGGRHGGGRGQNQSSSNGSSDAAPVDAPPPLLSNDSILNVQQDAKNLQVSLGNTDRLDARLDGSTRQTLNGSAVAQTRVTPDGLQISMQFDGGIRLEQSWVKSPDGHHLIVTEQWTNPTVKQPIEFKRSYDRLDI